MKLWPIAVLLCMAGCGPQAQIDSVVSEWCAQVEVAGQLSIEVFTSSPGAGQDSLRERRNLEIEKLRGLVAPEAIRREFASMGSPGVIVGSDQYRSLGDEVADFLEQSCPDVSSDVVSLYRGVLEQSASA